MLQPSCHAAQTTTRSPPVSCRRIPFAAALAVLNRIGLHEKSGIEVGGENGNPLITRIERVIVDKASE